MEVARGNCNVHWTVMMMMMMMQRKGLRSGVLGERLGAGLTAGFDHLQELVGGDRLVGGQVVQLDARHLVEHEFDAVEQDIATALGQVANVVHRRATLVDDCSGQFASFIGSHLTSSRLN